MDQATIDRYQPGGDIYNTILTQYGVDSAHAIANAALTGDRGQVSDALATARNDGPALDDSTANIFLDQIETNPLGAPIEAANAGLKNTLISLIKNPLVIGAIAVGAFFALGGADVLRRYIKKL